MNDVCKNEKIFGPQRIGTSKFFFDVWYRITNEKALVPIGHCGNGWNMDCYDKPSTYLVGDYSREKFNAVKFQFNIWNSTGFFDKKPSYRVSVLCFADTRDTGAETIVHLTTDDPDKIDKRLFEYSADVLAQSGAVLDADLNQEDFDKRAESIKAMQAYNDKLARIMQIAQACKNLKELYSEKEA